MNKDSSFATLEDINFVRKLVQKIEDKNLASNHLNLGIFYGLFFGIIGNLFITLLFDYTLKDLSSSWKFYILMSIIVLVLFFLLIVIKETKDFKIKQEKIENQLSNLNIFEEKIKIGEHVNKWHLIDTRNLVEKYVVTRNEH